MKNFGLASSTTCFNGARFIDCKSMTRNAQQPDHGTVGSITRRMRAIGMPPLAIESFLLQYEKLVQGFTGFLDRTMIQPLEKLPAAESLERHTDAGRAALKRTLIIKLNGGLGTSMGLDRTKSLLIVKIGLTFLDVVIGQVQRLRQQTGSPIPLILMNSFNTDEETRAALAKLKEKPITFVQHQVPKIRQDNLQPVDWPADPSREWCPPGHGDIYPALVTSGLLTSLLEQGFEYAFVSNIDNLGATISFPILGYFAAENIPFLMEVTARTEADKKGGHLARLNGGGLILRERAQCPDAERQEFQDIRKYKYFNTNNLWINLKALKAQLDRHGHFMELPLIVNRKPVDPADPKSAPVYQLESAMGAAISVFPDAGAVCVPRERFAPVKTTDDLLALWSDAYVLGDDMHMNLHPARKGKPVVVHLDPAHFGAYENLKARVSDGVPSLLNCESLTVKGDFKFGRNVTVTGKVTLEADGPKQNLIPDNSILK
jgi:UTP--glucose-1-phosphate uridylyltransferase